MKIQLASVLALAVAGVGITDRIWAVAAAPAGGQPQSQNADAPSKIDAAKPVELDLIDANCLHSVNENGTSTIKVRGYCRLNDTMVLTFSNLPAWQNDPNAKGNDPSNLLLVINGRVIKGLAERGPMSGESQQSPPAGQNANSAQTLSTPTAGGAAAQSTSPQTYQIFYDLKYLDLLQDDQDSVDNRNAWSALFSRSKGSICLKVSVAPAGKAPYLGMRNVTFQVLSEFDVAVAVLGFLGLLITFLVLARHTDIVRDGPSVADPAHPGKKIRMTYSLARCQMAWWFFFVVGGFLYIWLVLGDRNSLTPGVLTLIGISAATGFGSFLVDSSKSDQRKSLSIQQSGLEDRLAELNALAGPLTPEQAAEKQQKQSQLDDVTNSIAALPSPVGPSQNFVVDLLQDESGISFHRFQMVAWTMILGIVFAKAVYVTLAMPDFSATLLGLMGISAGTYIGFKIPNPPKAPGA